MPVPSPDFARLRTALLCQGEPDRVPLLELLVNQPVKEAFIGRPILTTADDIAFWYEAGYDGYSVCPGYTLNPGGDVPKEGRRRVSFARSAYTEALVEQEWAPQQVGFITTWEEFERHRWPQLAEVDFSALDYSSRPGNLPDGMQLIARAGDIFTHTWEFMGFQVFSYALVEDPGLVAAVFAAIGEFIYGVFERLAQYPQVGALWYSDDIAFNTGCLCSPAVLREHLFPWVRKIGDLARGLDVPFLYHTDGNIWQVMEDLIGCGVTAIHPIEPKGLVAEEVKAKVGDRLCLVGNVEVDRLARGTPEEIDALCRDRIEKLGPGGGYCLGSSNTIPEYVPLPNYKALLAAAHKYGHYPIGG
jgi:uroporphyrinogen decarboxylase